MNTQVSAVGVAALALVLGMSTCNVDAGTEFVTLNGVIRDFKSDHPDFNVVPSNGYGHYCGNIDEELGSDGKPIFTGNGFRVAQEWRDRNSNMIAWCTYDISLDDREGKGQRGSRDTGAITSAETFEYWFRDYPGINTSAIVPIDLRRDDAGFYHFETNNFTPIDGRLLGDEDEEHNFHFTFEIVADFIYHADDDQMLEFTGDDDLWVFIDGRLVIDLGGIGGNQTQIAELNRLNLVDGERYRMHFFHAERKQPKSHFRILTNIDFVQERRMPSVTDQFD